MNTKTVLLALIFACFCYVGEVYGQDKAQISGRVIDQAGEALPFVNVSLVKADSSSQLVTGEVTNENGEFSLKTDFSGLVKLVVSFVGFETFQSDPFMPKPGENNSFASVALAEEVGVLKEVDIRAARPEVTVTPDKTVVNIEGTVMAEGNTALDVIGRSPGVYVDENDNINLNGRSGVTVMINDRPTYMSANDLANFLRSMPADNIKSIEIINNPTARFDAEGAAGIINIRLKKNNVDGVFGNVHVGGMYNGTFSPNTGISLNVKKGKWTNNASLNYSEFNFLNELDIIRRFQQAEGVTLFDQNSDLDIVNKSLFFRGGTDYQINENHIVGVNLQASQYQGLDLGNSMTSISNQGTENLFYLRSVNDSEDGNYRIFGNLHYIGILDTLGTKITTDIDYTRMSASSDAILTNDFWENDQLHLAERDFIKTENGMHYDIYTAKVDFVKPMGKGRIMEAGVKGSWMKSDNDLDLQRAVADGTFQPDPNSNHFLYEENVLAAYISYKGSFSDKLGFQAGLRGEHSDITGNSLTLNQINTQKYFNLFPSLSLQQQVHKNYQIIYNANRRITRPNYRLLNPFVFFIDPLTSERGNPNLRPQYAYNFEMNHVIHQAYQLSFTYSLTTDVFQQIFTQDEEDLTTTTFNANLDRSQNWNFRAIIPLEIKSWWNTSNMVQVNHAQWKSPIGEDLLDVSQTSLTLRTQHSFVLPGGIKAELVGMYVGPAQYGQAAIGGFGWVDAGLTKNFMDDKLSLSVNGTDLFRTQVIRADILFGAIDSNFEQYRSNQGVRFTLRYKFAKGEKFRVSERSGSNEERNRLD